MGDVAEFLRSYQYDTAAPISTRPDANDTTASGSTGPTNAQVDAETVVQFRNAALAADVDGLVSQIAQSRLRGFTLATIFDEVATPALVDIGERWSRGVLTVSQEHIAATAVIEALARTRPLIERTGRDRGTVLLACPDEEQHDIAMRMGSLLAYGLGFNAMLIGARVPVADLALLIAGERPRYVLVSASVAVDPRTAAHNLAAIAEAAHSAHAITVAGGHGFVALRDSPAGVRIGRTMTELLSVLQTA